MSVLPIAVTNKVTAVAGAEGCLHVCITYSTQTTEFMNEETYATTDMKFN
jgi:hypothetical protein